MSIDLNNFRNDNGLIPAKTVAIIQMRLRSGDDYLEGVLKRTRNGDAYTLDIEYTVVEGQYATQKFNGYPLVQGETEGQKGMVLRTMSLLRGINDSAKFLDPNDQSPEACAQRKIEYRDLDYRRFLGEIGIEKGKDGFPDRNILLRAITRDMPQWGGRPPIDQPPPSGGGSTSGAPPSGAAPSGVMPASIEKPKWA
jgi:hypothetical protein